MLTFVGTGGVGKTTLSIAAAIQAARSGKKVAAITIDPSRRLASALGFKGIDESYKQLNWNEFAEPMDVYFLNTEESFNQFVKENLSENLFEKISASRIFQQISKNLRETHNFSAIYKLEKILKEKDYDLVILDTPPCHQVIDFFKSPKQLKKFFNSKEQPSKGVSGWIQSKGFSVLEGVLKNIAGKDFASETSLFFKNIGDLQKSVNSVSENFLQTMALPTSQMVLVCSSALDKVEEAAYLQEGILTLGYQVGFCAMNRAYIDGLDQRAGRTVIEDPKEKELYDYFMNKEKVSRQAIDKMKSLAVFEKTQFSLLPELEMDLSTQQDILNFSNLVSQKWIAL